MRFIENNGKKLSEVVLGIMRIDNMSEGEVLNLLNTAYEEGINVIDSADIYGRGQCENILGNVIKNNKGLREKFFIQSKCGIRIEDGYNWFDFSKDYIIESVDGILKRMNTEYIDALLLHRPDALMEPEEIAEAFETLEKAGKVRNFGVCNMNSSQIEYLKKCYKGNIIANQLQLSCAFTPMIDASFNVNMQNEASCMKDDGVLNYCRINDIIIQSWSSLQYGYFQGVFLDNEKYSKLNEVLKRIAEEQNVTKSAIAIAWILRIPGKVQSVIGTTKDYRVGEIARACDVELTKKQWYEIYAAAGNRLP